MMRPPMGMAGPLRGYPHPHAPYPMPYPARPGMGRGVPPRPYGMGMRGVAALPPRPGYPGPARPGWDQHPRFGGPPRPPFPGGPPHARGPPNTRYTPTAAAASAVLGMPRPMPPRMMRPPMPYPGMHPGMRPGMRPPMPRMLPPPGPRKPVIRKPVIRAPKVQTGLKLPSSTPDVEKWIYAKVVSVGTGTKCINGEYISGIDKTASSNLAFY